jgi:ribosomal protein L37AE/L43A
MSVWDLCPMCGCADVKKISKENQWLCKECQFEFKKGYVYFSEVDNPNKWS